MSDQINLSTMTIPELQEIITNSVKAALMAWSPPQVAGMEEKKYLSRKDLCDQLGVFNKVCHSLQVSALSLRP